jgi:hypothetical protein
MKTAGITLVLLNSLLAIGFIVIGVFPVVQFFLVGMGVGLLIASRRKK